MNEKEFRVGNYVMYNDRVAELSWQAIGNIAEGYEFKYSYIPLTEEWLRKFGFENQNHEEWQAFAYKDTPICSYFDGVEWCFKYGYDSDLTFAACEYVHQLQNLYFALTNEELTLNDPTRTPH